MTDAPMIEAGVDAIRAHIERLKREAIAEARAELGPDTEDDGHAAKILRRTRRESRQYFKRESTKQREE